MARHLLTIEGYGGCLIIFSKHIAGYCPTVKVGDGISSYANISKFHRLLYGLLLNKDKFKIDLSGEKFKKIVIRVNCRTYRMRNEALYEVESPSSMVSHETVGIGGRVVVKNVVLRPCQVYKINNVIKRYDYFYAPGVELDWLSQSVDYYLDIEMSNGVRRQTYFRNLSRRSLGACGSEILERVAASILAILGINLL